MLKIFVNFFRIQNVQTFVRDSIEQTGQQPTEVEFESEDLRFDDRRRPSFLRRNWGRISRKNGPSNALACQGGKCCVSVKGKTSVSF